MTESWRVSLALGASVVALLAPPVAGQPEGLVGSEDPWLEALVAEALESSPDLRAAREAALSAAARPAQARTLPNPMFVAVYTNDGWSPSLGSQEMTTLGVMGSQEILFPGKRSLSAEILTREAEQVDQLVSRVTLSVSAAVKRAYYDLWLARELLELIGDQQALSRQIEIIARTSYTVGRGAQQDLLRAQIEVTRIEQLRLEQQAAEEVRLAELNRLRNQPEHSPVETAPELELIPTPNELEHWLERLTAVSPEVRSSSLGVRKAELAVQLARKQFKPDFSVSGGYMNRGGLDPMWQAGFGVSLPLYRTRPRSALASAEAEERAVSYLEEGVRLLLRQRIAERLALLGKTQRVAELYGAGILPQDQISLEAAVANYQTGQVPFVAVLEALNTLYGDKTTYLRLLSEHNKLRASLEEASLEETMGMADVGAMTSTATVGGGGAMASGRQAGDGMGMGTP